MKPDWQAPEARMVLLALANGRSVSRLAWSRLTLEWLEQRRWIRREAGTHAWLCEPGHREDMCALLDRIWGAWREESCKMQEQEFPYSPEGWQRYMDARRSAWMAQVQPPQLMAFKTAAAALRGNSKSHSALDRYDILKRHSIDNAGAARIRPSPGLRFRFQEHEIDAEYAGRITGEVVVTERRLAQGLTVSGVRPRAVITVENAATFIDMPQVEGLLLVHLPGTDQRAGFALLKQLPDVPWAHFGDLDPAGLDLYRRCLVQRHDCLWLVPLWWPELLSTHALRDAPWPGDLVQVPELVAFLAASSIWLEQEALVLDPRLEEQLLHWVNRGTLDGFWHQR